MKYVSSIEIRSFLGISRQRVLAIARREDWRLKSFDRPYWYDLEDVEKYLYNKEHTDKSRDKYNATFVGLLRHDENGFHKKCAVCKNALTFK